MIKQKGCFVNFDLIYKKVKYCLSRKYRKQNIVDGKYLLQYASKLSLQYVLTYEEKYFQKCNFVQQKQQWSTIELYKIKKVFESFSKKIDNSDHHLIPCESLKQMFTQFNKYDQKHIHRIHQLFDFQQKGFIDWNNFYTFITICYKASTQILSLIMFIIFDESLSKKLNRDQLNLMIDLNANYIKQSSVDHEAYIFDPDDIGDILIPPNEQFISVEKWLSESQKIFDFQKYRKFFNIFIQIKLQKELIQNFQSWNQVFNESERKYISYVIDFKWFQLWKAYASAQYGVSINSYLKNPNNTFKTIKSFKTKKTLKTINSIKSQKKIITKSLFHSLEDQKIKNIDQKSYCKNYNLIHRHIGSRPQKMFNQQLQGQYLQVLAPQLVQNMNYTLVSQKVWKKLKFIYQAYPEFRRTGSNNIQLYPKRVKVYSSLFKQKLDYSSEIIREVPCYTTIQDLLKVSLQIEHLNTKFVYFKTVGMNKWEQLTDLSFMFTELTSQILIFLAYFDANDAFLFKKNHCKVAQNIVDVNLGDQIKFDHSQNSELKKAIYMGQTQNGKQIIHFKGSSHIYDEYVQRQKFLQKATIVHRNNTPIEQIKFFPLDVPILPSIKSYSFINSLIIMLLSDNDIKSILAQLPSNNENKQLLEILAYLNKQSKKKIKVDNSVISDLVEYNLSEFNNFQFGMIDQCFRTIMEILDKNFRKAPVKNIIRERNYFTLIRKIKCLHCSDLNVYNQKCYSLNIELPQTEQKYFQFIFVPFSSTLKSLDLKKYGLKMKLTSTFKQYKSQVSKLIEFENKSFVICQVYANDIIRNFSSVKEQMTLQQLNLKQTDKIVVYEFCVSLTDFVNDHYTQVKDITQKKFKKGDLIDCKTKQDRWIAGKIIEIEFMPYTQKTMIRVSHKNTTAIQSKKEYELSSESMAIFPTRSYLYDNQYHLKVIQRCYNEALNEMLLSNIPLVVVLTDWMRCKEFQFIIYQQLKIFIAQNYRFKDIQYDDDDQFYSKPNPKFLSYKYSKKQKVKRFRDYLSSQNFPYSISILDLNGRCLVCHKIHKTKIFKGESEYYCSGCKLNQQIPITWQVKVFNCMVCIDWHCLDKFRKNIIKDHKSFTDMIMNKKNDIQRLEKLIEQKFTKKVLILEQQCCNFPYKTVLSEEMKSYPSQLVIQIERLVEDRINKTINRKHINFPIDELKVSHKTYLLTGVISLEGTSSIIYKNYVSNQNQEWFQVYGQSIKKVKKNIVQKCCALFLIYNIKHVQEEQQKIQQCRESAEILSSDFDLNSSPSEKQVRGKNKKLTINQRLQNIDSEEEDFSYLNTEKQDEIQFEGRQDSGSNSDFPPQRSSSKRSAHYVKDSKQLIKSVSEVGKSSHDQRDNVKLIRHNKAKIKLKDSIKNHHSNFSFSGQKDKKQRIILRSSIQPKQDEETKKPENNVEIPHKNLFEWITQFKFEVQDKVQEIKLQQKINENEQKQNLKVETEKILKVQKSESISQNMQFFEEQSQSL